jgi:phosphatidate cytidylyltransferase
MTLWLFSWRKGVGERNKIMQQSASSPPLASPDPAAANRQWLRALLLRVLTAIVGIPIILALLWFGGWVLFAGLAVIVTLAIYELHRMLAGDGKHPLSVLSLALSLDFLLAAQLPSSWRYPLIEGGISLLLLLAFSWLLVVRRTLEGSLVDWALTMALPLYVGWPLSAFLLLRGSQLAPSIGFWWVLLVLVSVWAFDSAAFFTGKYLGRHKMTPLVSPGKTWEGMAGGTIACIAATMGIGVLALGQPIYHTIILGLLISVFGQMGDLAESLLKRQTHVKDSSHLIPGHGGILDRIDSQLFAVVVVTLYMQWVLYPLS